MNSPVFTSLIPVILFIAIGFYVGRRGWIRAESVKDLANLVFMVLTPALLHTAYGVRARIEHCSLGHPLVLADEAIPLHNDTP